MARIIELKRIEEPNEDYDRLEKRLKEFFKEKIYIPLLISMNLPRKILKNAKPTALEDALFTGRLIYLDGQFSGKLNASLSKELRALGAKFDRRYGSYRLPENQIPIQMKQLISASQSHFDRKMASIDQKLSELLPEEIADQFHCADLFDKTLWKADRQFKENVKKISVTPELSAEQRARIAKDWQDNMRLYIKDWTKTQIKELRKEIFEQITSGARRAALIPPILKVTETIQKSHEEALKKAKFLAHQESRLLMGTYKKMKYEAAGSKSYIWRCVHRPHDMSPDEHVKGNVRYTHGLLEGKEIFWNDPPITSNPGEPIRKNHAGFDYNCRCFSRPLIRI